MGCLGILRGFNPCFNGFHPPTETWNPVAGAVEFLDDVELKGKLVEEHQFLKAWGLSLIHI